MLLCKLSVNLMFMKDVEIELKEREIKHGGIENEV